MRLTDTAAMALTRMLHTLGWDVVMRYSQEQVRWEVTVVGRRV